MKPLLSILFVLFLYLPLRAQDSTGVVTGADSLLVELADSSKDSQELLPKKILFTQRAFWGPKGLLRVTNLAPLTPEGRTKELNIRRTMLVSHQVLGFVTLAGMVAQGILGSQLYNAKGDRYVRLHNTHEGMGTFINYTYGTTAILSLTAPPRLPTSAYRRGFSSIQLHKYLAVIHLAGMVATNVLAHRIDENYKLKPYHRAAAYTTFVSFAAAVIAIKIR